MCTVKIVITTEHPITFSLRENRFMIKEICYSKKMYAQRRDTYIRPLVIDLILSSELDRNPPSVVSPENSKKQIRSRSQKVGKRIFLQRI